MNNRELQFIRHYVEYTPRLDSIMLKKVVYNEISRENIESNRLDHCNFHTFCQSKIKIKIKIRALVLSIMNDELLVKTDSLFEC